MLSRDLDACRRPYAYTLSENNNNNIIIWIKPGCCMFFNHINNNTCADSILISTMHRLKFNNNNFIKLIYNERKTIIFEMIIWCIFVLVCWTACAVQSTQGPTLALRYSSFKSNIKKGSTYTLFFSLCSYNCALCSVLHRIAIAEKYSSICGKLPCGWCRHHFRKSTQSKKKHSSDEV